MDWFTGFRGDSLAITRGSALTNTGRPSVAVSVVICALAGRGAPNTLLNTKRSTSTLLRFKVVCRPLMRLGEGIGSKIRCAALAASGGAVRHRVVRLRSSTLLTSIAECCTCEATLLALPAIIARVPAGRGRFAR